MNYIAIAGEKRTETGKKATKAVRNSGRIPACIYGKENIEFSTTHKDVKPLIYTPDFNLAEITIDGQVYKCILKDTQFHPTTDEIVHIDFQELIPERPIKVEVPVRLQGTAAGVRSGGKLMPLMRKVKIKATPENIVDQLVADVTELELGNAMRVNQLEIPEGVELMIAPSIPICSVEVPRALRSATDAEEKAAGGAEGEGEEEDTEGGEE